MELSGLIVAVVLIIIILVSLSVHEFAHAAIANLFGDPTARLEGRMTLNPLKHWDQVGTTLLVGLIFLRFGLGFPLPFIFGWGKPVPVNENNFENPRLHGLHTALAGPMSNLILATLLSLVLKFFNLPSPWENLMILAVYINLILMFFNLLPIPPLDGSRILRLFISEQAYFALASNPMIFFALIFVVFFFLLQYIVVASLSLCQFLVGNTCGL